MLGTKRVFGLLLLVLTLLLGGCIEKEPAVTTEPTTEPAVTYTVRYTALGYIHAEYEVELGEYPTQVMPAPEGLQITSWQDKDGNTVDPLKIPVTRDMQYNAVAYPALTNHAPYLFTDENGFLNPDAGLTAQQLKTALQALAAESAEKYFPGMSTGDAFLTGKQLIKNLSGFFPEEKVRSVFSSEKNTVTRGEFAVGMQTLLERNNAELLTLSDESVLPADVNLERADAIALLEASVPHTPAESGGTWLQLDLPTTYAPGFVNIEGYLYYVQENGYFLREDSVGKLQFGKDGRYTSGDPELDVKVAEILAKIVAEDPDGERLQWLRSAYEHCRDSFTYRRREAYTKGQTGWEVDDAKKMFETTKGNCYNFAAAFWALARGLGYEARAISGTCLKDEQPHGWVFIEIDGEDYLFDPEWEYVYYYERDDRTKDMFMMPMDKIGWWNYRW